MWEWLPKYISHISHFSVTSHHPLTAYQCTNLAPTVRPKSCPVGRTSKVIIVYCLISWLSSKQGALSSLHFIFNLTYHIICTYVQKGGEGNCVCSAVFINQRLLASSFRLLIRWDSTSADCCPTIACINLPNHRKVVLIKDLAFVLARQFTDKVAL